MTDRRFAYPIVLDLVGRRAVVGPCLQPYLVEPGAVRE